MKNSAFQNSPTGEAQDDASPVSPSLSAPHLSTQQMGQWEQAFRERVETTRQPSHRLSRLRLWLIFLLVRHAALRLGEALRLNDEEDLDLEACLLRVPGAQARELPMPRVLVFQLRRFFSLPSIAARRGDLTRLDPGYVRRNFYARARECGLPPDLASPRALRQSRAVEMIQNGMPLPAVQRFLGQSNLESTREFLSYSDADIQTMTRHYLKREAKLRTSARNAFSGLISRIRREGFLAEVRIASFTGLDLVAIITEESLENLELKEGMPVVATVKAPWVILGRADAAAPVRTSARNRFTGKVTSIRRSGLVSEVMVELPEGNRVCALMTTDSADDLELAPGETVTVMFKALTVILSVV